MLWFLPQLNIFLKRKKLILTLKVIEMGSGPVVCQPLAYQWPVWGQKRWSKSMLLKCPHWKISNNAKGRMQTPSGVFLQVYKIILNTLSNEVHEIFWILVHNTCCFNVKLAFTVKISKNWCSCRLREGEWLSQGHRARTSQYGTGSQNSWFQMYTCHLSGLPSHQALAVYSQLLPASPSTLRQSPKYWGKPLLSFYQNSSIHKFNTINSYISYIICSAMF